MGTRHHYLLSSCYMLGIIRHFLPTPLGGCYEPIYKLRSGGSVRVGDLSMVTGLASQVFWLQSPVLSSTPYCLLLFFFFNIYIYLFDCAGS